MTPNAFNTRQNLKSGLESSLRRLGPSMARLAAETAGAFLSAEAVPAGDWTAVPRLPDQGQLRCSQRNVGGKHEMVCNLSVEKSEWRRLFANGEDEELRADAFREMANCICGSLVADTAFADEFGCLTPTVPCAVHTWMPAGTGSWRGAFRVGGAWVHFSVSVHEASGILSRHAMAVA